MLTIILASDFAEDEPAAATPLLVQAEALASASGNSYLRDWARTAQAAGAATHGDLVASIDLAGDVITKASSTYWTDAVRVLGFAGLLARDEEALRLAVDVGERALRASPGPAIWTGNARHRLRLLEGHPSIVDPGFRDPSTYRPPVSCATLWLLGRETLDAGAVDVAIVGVRARARPVPHAEAVRAAIDACATGDEDRWHDALTIAVDQDLRLIAVDALEGLAVAATAVESWAECLRLLAAAQRLRDETGYRWRFPSEERSVTSAHADALAALSDAASTAITEGNNLDWRQAAAYAGRARGVRNRPHHGWASLTPTEQQVVALVAQGLTNPQIAARLFIGRTTVKTHLEHVFTKLNVRTRAQLAAEAARQPPPSTPS